MTWLDIVKSVYGEPVGVSKNEIHEDIDGIFELTEMSWLPRGVNHYIRLQKYISRSLSDYEQVTNWWKVKVGSNGSSAIVTWSSRQAPDDTVMMLLLRASWFSVEDI